MARVHYQLERFKKVLDEVGYEITAEDYDKLKFQKPHRASLRRISNLNWKDLKQSVKDNVFEDTDTKPDTNIEKNFTKDRGIITTKSLNIKTVDDALKEAEVDTAIWEVDRYVINSWEVTMGAKSANSDIPQTYTNWQVKVWLKRIKVDEIVEAFNNVILQIPEYKVTAPPRFTAASGTALEIAIVDVHLAKLAWDKETGRRNYKTSVAVKDYEEVIDKNLMWAEPFKPEKIFFIVGNDLMHIENYSGITPIAGHLLDTDSRFPKVAEAAFEINLKAIYKCRLIAKTEVIWIPGNHDPHASLLLTMMLREHFRNDNMVTVDVGPAKRKARLWGNLLVGWAHEINNRQSAWANELAQAFPQEWGKSVWREWHHGHKHKKGEVKTHPIITHGGVLCRQLTALSPIDAWHFENLFTDAVPGGEAFLWSKDNGVIANFTAWTNTGIASGR